MKTKIKSPESDPQKFMVINDLFSYETKGKNILVVSKN